MTDNNTTEVTKNTPFDTARKLCKTGAMAVATQDDGQTRIFPLNHCRTEKHVDDEVTKIAMSEGVLSVVVFKPASVYRKPEPKIVAEIL